MKIMIVPMSAMAETHGPVSRCEALAYDRLHDGESAPFHWSVFSVYECHVASFEETMFFGLHKQIPIGYGK